MLTDYQNTDMLDIIFENRNHAYGAYALRRTYNKSLQQAMLIVFSSVLLLLFGNFLREKFGKNDSPVTFLKGDHFFSNVPKIDLPKKDEHDVKPPKPPKPVVQPPKQTGAIATVRNTEIQVVQNDRVEQDTIIPITQVTILNPGATTDLKVPIIGIGGSDGHGKDQIFEGGKEDGPSQIVMAPEVMPEFPGGEEALMRFLSRNTVYPEMERSSGIQGKTYIQFVVNEDGSITNATVMRSESYGFSREALRVVSILPKFKPGLQQGHPVRVQYVLPFTFKIRD